MKKMTVCYFGIYDKNYPRNKIIISGLKGNGVKIIECNSRKPFLFKYFDLICQYYKKRKKFDIMVVGFPGQTIMILAKLFCRKKIIFDAFTSVYDSYVCDRKLVSHKSLKAKYYYFLDWFSCRLADKILLDTETHIDYFVKTFKIRKEKFICLYVGSTPEIFYPRKNSSKKDKFIVHFHASGIPLQGIEYVLDAAKELENISAICFNIVGGIQSVLAVRKRLASRDYKNVNFIASISASELARYINQADISLGIFGNTSKTKKVVPNKVFEALACRKPIITAKTIAVQEILTDKKHLLFCCLADGKDLTQKILKLKKDSNFRNQIAENGYRLFINRFIPKKVVEPLVRIIKNN